MTALTEFLGVRRAVALWESRTDAELGGFHGLGLSEFAALHHLAEAPGGRLRRIDLARRVALTASAVTRLLAPLEKRGIVTRERDGSDARATYAALTRSGRVLVKEATGTVERIAESLLSSLSERDRQVFEKLAASAL